MRALSLCVVVVAAGSIAAAVEPARACSCIPPDPWSFLKQADGAFVGRLVSRRETDQGRAVLTFRVERAVKGTIGATVEVTTANNGAACGIEMPVGQRTGLFLIREGGRWVGHLCWQVAPEDLLAAAALPAPNGTGPVALVVAGSFGPAQRLALDAKGRTLAYGMGGGTVEAFSVCPGGRRVAEVVGSTGRYVVTIRDLPSLRFVRRQSGLDAVYAEEIACTSESGEQLAVFFSTTGARGRLTRVTRRSRTTIWRGKAFYASFWKHLVYVQTLHRTLGITTLVAVDVRTGSTTKLGTVLDHGAYQLVPNSAGTRLAGDAFEEGCRAAPCWWLVRVDLEQRPISERAVPHPTQQYCGGSSHWLRDGRIAYVCDEWIFVYDAALRLSGRVSNWSAVSTAVVGSKIVGVTDLGELLRVELPSGRIDIVRRLPGVPYVVASVNG